MKIRKHSSYYTYSNLIFYYLTEGIKSYAVFIKDADKRFALAHNSNSKTKAQPDRLFRLYHNLFIECYNESDALVGFYLV